MQRLAKKVLLIGWDGADWKMINRLIDEGKMPTMKYLVENGTMGNLATLDPPFSPMLWTSIATGVRPDKHGILGFSEPDPNMHAIRPVSSSSRKVKAIWNILTQKGMKSHVVGWWPSHPAEPINGIMISNHFHQMPKNNPHHWPIAPGTVHPAELSEFFAHFRIRPNELTVQHIQPFVPDYEKVDQDKDRRLESIARITAECSTIHAAATMIMEMEPWDLMAVYYDSIDHYSHGYMNFNPPRMKNIPEHQFELYKGVVEAGYRFHDLMLKRLLEMAGEEATVIVISDHGFHPDHLRPHFLSDEPAGPAMQHRDHGIFVAKGPGIRKDERIYGACLLDITPTLLTLFGLPIGQDMDGVPLVQIYENEIEIETIPSWEKIEGNAGMLPPESQTDPIAAQEALKQLVELGYIDEPDENKEIAINKTIKEMQYNLGRVYLGASKFEKAEEIFTALNSEDPHQPRFILRLINIYMSQNRLEECKNLLDEFLAYEKEYVKSHKIDEITKEKMPEDLDDKAKEKWHKTRKKQISRIQQAHSDLLLLQVIKGDLLLKQNKPKEALAIYLKIAKVSKSKTLHIQVGNALLKLKRWEHAKENFLKALEYDENAFAPHLGLCRVYAKQRKYEDAIEHGLTAVGLAYNSPLAHYYIGEAMVLYRQYEPAEKAFLLALNMMPNLGQARNYLIYLYDTILKTPQKSIEHRDYFSKKGLTVHSPKEEGFDDHVDENFSLMVENDDSEMELVESELIQTEKEEEFTPLIVKRNRKTDSEPVIVVSGLPRSGTSMMMQMLDAAGLPIFTDNERAADESNPKGYYEHKAVKSLMLDASWVKDTPGKVVKVISQLLFHLPARYAYKVIFMDRDLKEVVMSQQAMLLKLGSKRVKADAYPLNIEKQFARNLAMVKRWEKTRLDAEVLHVDHADAIKNPLETAKMIADFLGKELDIQKMAAVVDSSLYRTKS
jgi:predicted AlkP superfamily phosphohydrolase/phosphomutase/tetratricopeptide (TPR) repeat protein